MARFRDIARSRERQDWSRLEQILDRVRARGVRSLHSEEIGELGALYRKTAVDLNYYRSHTSDARLTQYLNGLVARAHNSVYRAGKLRSADITGFFLRGFPRTVRRNAGWILLATGLFLVAGVLGALEQHANPLFYRIMIPEQIVESLEEGEPWYQQISVGCLQPQASSFIMTNNITVSIAAFALGITAGLGTAYLMVMNGVMIGTVGHLCAEYDNSVDFWAFVAPHGVLELPAIFIAGGAGLLLGSSLILGDRHRRIDMLRIKGREAVRLLGGIVPILVFAGLVEGFFSPMPYAYELKFAVAGFLFLLLVVYLLVGGREPESSS